jgi:TPR repeat protein
MLLGSESDPPAAMVLLQQAAEAGHADAMARLGIELRRGSKQVPKDLPAAYRWSLQSKEAGSALGLCALAWHLDNAVEVARDHDGAASLFGKAAERAEELKTTAEGLHQLACKDKLLFRFADKS